jgi:hypothetical protein
MCRGRDVHDWRKHLRTTGSGPHTTLLHVAHVRHSRLYKLVSWTINFLNDNKSHNDMSKARLVNKDWEFVSKGTEISMGKIVSEYFTSLTLGSKTGVVSTEDTDEIWKASTEEAMEKVKGRTTSQVRVDSPMIDEVEVEKSF